MQRITHRENDTVTVTDPVEAAEKLAKFEDLCEQLEAQQEQLSAQLAALRAAGKEKTARFRELMGQKLVNASTIGLLKGSGLL